MPAPVSPRLSFASGFLLDTIPGWHKAMTLPRGRAQGAASRRPRAGPTSMARAAEGNAAFGLANFGQYVLTECHTPETKALEGRTVADVAAERGLDPFDALCEIVVADDLRTGFSFPPNGDSERDWAARLEVWRDDRSVLGASDAGAHLDFLATFNFPTVMLRRAVADLGLLSWEEAIALLTDAPARLYGLRDRGRLAVGCVGRRRRARSRPRSAPHPISQPGRPAGRRLAPLRRGRRHRPRARQRRRRRRRRQGHRRPPGPGPAVRHRHLHRPGPMTPTPVSA